MQIRDYKNRLAFRHAFWNFLLSIFITFSFLVWNGTASAGDTIKIAGSSTVKPIVEAAAPGFKKANAGMQIIIGGGGSSNGIKNAANKNVDIGMASRKLKEKEKKAFPDLVPLPIGQDGVAVIVNKKNPIEGLTTAQVRDLYTGQATNWKDLGGGDIPVHLVGILLHHGTSSVFMKFVGLEGKEQGEGAQKEICYWKKSDSEGCQALAQGVDGNQPACAAVMTKAGAVAFASIGFAKSLADKGAPVKLLKLDGVEPKAANVVSGAYKLSRPLQVITNGPAKGTVKNFIDYLLSPEGQKLVKEKGYIPVQ